MEVCVVGFDLVYIGELEVVICSGCVVCVFGDVDID